MVEPLLYVALGFLLASLLGLFVCRAVWRRAVRLTTRRIMRRMPVSQAEIAAGRDLLRAEHAVATRTLERRVNVLRTRAAEKAAEAGRREAAFARASEDLAQAHSALGAVAAREAGIRSELEAVQAGLAEARRELPAARTALGEATRKLELALADAAELRVIADTRQVEIAAVKTDLAHVTDTAQQLRRELDAARTALVAEAGRAEELAGSLKVAQATVALGAARQGAQPADNNDDLLRKRIEDLASDIARLASAEGGEPRHARQAAGPAAAPAGTAGAEPLGVEPLGAGAGR